MNGAAFDTHAAVKALTRAGVADRSTAFENFEEFYGEKRRLRVECKEERNEKESPQGMVTVGPRNAAVETGEISLGRVPGDPLDGQLFSYSIVCRDIHENPARGYPTAAVSGGPP